MTETILGNGTIVTGGTAPQVLADGAVVWRDDRIVAVGPESELRGQFPSASYLDARGGLILPGLVNLHHHFYSALARGLDVGIGMKNFREVLDRLWWRLDRALEPETVAVSAELAAAESVRSGVTTVFDHHASPWAIADSLDVIAEAVEKAGLSAVLCYEITDRNGHDEALAGLEENLRFLRERRDDPRIRGTIGLHASFTLRDDTLTRVAESRPKGSGCHIHVAEDRLDIDATREVFGTSPIPRLERFNLIDRQCLIAHGIHLGPESYASIARHGSVLIHNPESNANNAVGHLDVAASARKGCLVALGTDGMSSSILRSLKSAFLLHRHVSRDPSSGFEGLPDLLRNNVEAARCFFDEPRLGELVPEAPADVIALGNPPPTPVTAQNLFGHLVYGASETPVRHTVARGKVLLKDFEYTEIDIEKISARAREMTPDLWEHIKNLRYGTSFLGDTPLSSTMVRPSPR